LFDLFSATLNGSRVGVKKPENFAVCVTRAFVKLLSAIRFRKVY
jgi:hypothetical protein